MTNPLDSSASGLDFMGLLFDYFQAGLAVPGLRLHERSCFSPLDGLDVSGAFSFFYLAGFGGGASISISSSSPPEVLE